jgi:DNA-binding NarL/FixJ family response regulator
VLNPNAKDSETPTTIRLLIVDDHKLVRDAVCNLVASHDDMEIIGQASNGYEAVRKAKDLRPDVVVLDICIPDLNGLKTASLIKTAAPKAQVVFLSEHDNSFFVREAFAAGALGYIAKRDAASELLSGIRMAHSEGRYVSKSVPADFGRNSLSGSAGERALNRSSCLPEERPSKSV